MWLVWTLLSNVGVLTAEYVFRHWRMHTYWQDAWLLIPLALVTQYFLREAFGGSPRYMVVWAAFFSINALGRIGINSLLLHEPLHLTTVVGIVIIWIGAMLVRL